MYHMIHASDHPEALPLMVRAYRKVSGRPDLEGKEEQLDMIDLLRDIQDEGAADCRTESASPKPGCSPSL